LFARALCIVVRTRDPRDLVLGDGPLVRLARALTARLSLALGRSLLSGASLSESASMASPPAARAAADPSAATCEPCEAAAPSSGASVSSAAAPSSGASPSASGSPSASSPTVAIVIGMAGSGKTSLMQRVNAYRHAKSSPPYVINLDPAVRDLPYDANVDIRDTVDYKSVMREYNLGPNGGILTAS
jgi:hypothetical protein